MARLQCHKRMQPDFLGRSERLLTLPGPTVCRGMCGEKEVISAEIWKDEDVVFKKWRIHLRSGNQEKIVKGGSPQKVFAFVEKLIEGIDCTPFLQATPSQVTRWQKYGLPYWGKRQ